MFIRRPPSIFLPLLLLCALPAVLALHRDKCAADIGAKLQNGSLKYDDAIFFRHDGVIMSNASNIELTIAGCEAQCGKRFNWYDDVGPRLTTWLIPVILLIGNLCLATLGKDNSLFTIIHLLGDPIDSLWSLLTKLESWNRCWDLAEHLSNTGAMYKDHVRDRGTILAAIQELEGPGCDPSETYLRIITHSTLDRDDPARPRLHHLCREIANEISDSSVNELPRTLLAIMSYTFAVLGAFVEAIGGKSSSQPGGRIGSAMFLSWLVPVVLLSNSIGSFTSRRTLVRILERFAKATKPLYGQQSVIPAGSPSLPKASRSPRFGGDSRRRGSSLSSAPSPQMYGLSPPINPMVSIIEPDHNSHSPQYLRKPSTEMDYLDLQIFSQDRPSTLFGHNTGALTTFDNAQPWFGGIYTYQSSKKLFEVPQFKKRAHHRFTLFFLSILPIIAATTAGFLIIWFTPTIGLTCRNVALLGVMVCWFISNAIGRLTWRTVATGRYHWTLTVIKDTIIAVPTLLLIFLMSSGIFNSCYCWSSVWSRGPQRAYIELEPDRDRKHNAETVYPALVWSCLGLQAFFFWIFLSISKRGRSMMRKDERTKMRDFWSVHRGVEGEEQEDGNGRRWRRMSRGAGREKSVSVGSVELYSVLPPPADSTPFLRR